MNAVLVVTNRQEDLITFCNELRNQSTREVKCTADLSFVLESIKGDLSAVLVIDGNFEGMSDFSLVKEILTVNAMTTISVIIDMDDEQFHEITEGLGILMQLPENPTRQDAATLWEQVRQVTGIAS